MITNEKPLAEVSNLRVHFRSEDGTVRAVDGLDFIIKRGETLGIVGESGSGKSMTAFSLLNLVPSPGEIVAGSRVVFDDVNMLRASDRELQAIRGCRAAMIFQEPMTSLNPVFRIGDQIREAIELHEPRQDRSGVEARVLGLLTTVGIPSPERIARAYPHTLSGGMRQRVMIAMALACDPELLIADEPTTALDVTIQAQILELMKDLKDSCGASILLISHNMGVIAEMCDRIIVMYAGKAVEEGPAHDVFHKPLHPYTRALLASVPSAAAKRGRLESIEGTVPNPLNMPPGCSFEPRCPERGPECRLQGPELMKISPGRAVRCLKRGAVSEAGGVS